MSLDPNVLVAFITAIPATLAVYYSRGARKIGTDNADRLEDAKGKLASTNSKVHELGNGVMDEKIRNAVREVVYDQPSVITEANVADMLDKFLNQQLD